MGRINLKDRLKQGLFFLDGAMGSELFARGAESGVCVDYLNIASPVIVRSIHRDYIHAGSNAVITNTFGSNRFALSHHGHSGMVREINIDGAKVARQAAGETKYVLGDIGPSGGFLQPLGGLEPAELKEAFSEQAQALIEGEVDGIIIETMSALEEVKIAIEASKEVCGGKPVFASVSFDAAGGGFRTMMGVDVEKAVEGMVSAGADYAGFNCGNMSMEDYLRLAERYIMAADRVGGVGVFAEPNAGRPEVVDGKTVYRVTCDEFAEAMARIYSAGIRILGGCCGTTPAHIEAMVKKTGSVKV